jgi:hypothetical protein
VKGKIPVRSFPTKGKKPSRFIFTQLEPGHI